MRPDSIRCAAGIGSSGGIACAIGGGGRWDDNPGAATAPLVTAVMPPFRRR